MKAMTKAGNAFKEIAPVILGAGAGISGVLLYGNMNAPVEERSDEFTTVAAFATGILGAGALLMACHNAKVRNNLTIG